MSANIVKLGDFKGRGPGDQITDADPIFAAIERYKKASAALDLEDQESQDAFVDAEFALVTTVPTTALGMRVKISLFMNDECLDGFIRETEGNATLRHFLNALYKSAHVIAGLPEPAIVLKQSHY
jgi:hypothetical protein